jgi:hypothetical protein
MGVEIMFMVTSKKMRYWNLRRIYSNQTLNPAGFPVGYTEKLYFNQSLSICIGYFETTRGYVIYMNKHIQYSIPEVPQNNVLIFHIGEVAF